MNLGKKIVDVLASYGFAVVLLLLLFILTLLGTLEQVDHGLYEVQKKYFESFIVWHELGDFVPIPLPGTVLVLGLLAVNLLLGGLVRIRKSKRTVGIIVIHVGIALMLAAGLVKLTISADGHVTLFEGESSDDFVSYYLWEVSIHDASAAVDFEEFLIDGDGFLDLEGAKSATFSDERLPFELSLSHFSKNCRVLEKGPMWESASPVVEGFAIKALPLEDEAERNLAGIYASMQPKDGGPPQDGLLFSAERFPWTFESGGKTWAVSLRHKRYRMPFAIHLDDFTRELHPRTGIAKSFMSDVTKAQDGDDQKIRISMNKPLRHAGLVLFQASWGPSDAGPNDRLFSTFAVVRNPSDHWPLYSCIIVGIGLLIAFGTKLLGYMRSQASARERSMAEAS